MIIELNPYDDSALVTLNGISCALSALLGSMQAQKLDAGQFEMLREADKRIDQVASELGE